MENPYKNRSVYTIAALRVVQEEFARVLKLVEEALPQWPAEDIYAHAPAEVGVRCTIANPALHLHRWSNFGINGRDGGVDCPSCLYHHYFGPANR